MPDFDLRSLYLALDAHRQARRLTRAQAMREINLGIASQSGRHPIARSTVSGLLTKSVAEGDGVLQMLRWLGRTPESFVPVLPESELHRLPDAGSDQILRFDTVKLHAAMDAERKARGLRWSEVASEIGGTSAASLRRLEDGGRIGFPGVMRVTRWLGRPAADFVRISAG